MKKYYYLIIVLIPAILIVSVTSPVWAEPAWGLISVDNIGWDRSEKQLIDIGYKLDDQYVKGYFSDAGSILVSPAHWDDKDWLKAFLLTGAAIVLYNNDSSIQNYFQDHRTSTTDGISGIAKYFGDYRVVIPSLTVFYLYGSSVKNVKAQQAALLGLESVIVADGLTGALKLAGHRHRPYTGDSHTWDGPGSAFEDRALSFPSFHTSTVFAVVTVMSSVYGDDHKWLPYTAYSLATLAALSRINDNEHWSSDVFIGAVLGYYTAKAVIGRHRQREASQMTVNPIFGEYGYGVELSYRF